MGSPQQFILGSKMKWTLCLFFVASASAAAVPKGRVLGLFSVVTFPNDECTTISTPAMSGICVTAEECANSGDTIAVASGNCASGFGVCCMRRIVAPGSITQDLTHIQNADFPGSETALNGAVAPAVINRVVNIMGGANICAIKLEFINVVLTAPAAATGICADQITVTTPARNPGAGFGIQALCGTLTGQHIYVDVNTVGGAMAATVNINTAAAIGARMWKILVRQIECNDVNLPPAGCLQYHTGLAGQITSFNGALAANAQQMIVNQNYLICIRQADGMCTVTYREARPTTTQGAIGGNIDSFNVGAEEATANDPVKGEALGASGIGATCIAIQTALATALAGDAAAIAAAKTPGTAVIIEPVGQICGGVFSGLDDQLLPGIVTGEFEVQVFVDGTATQPNSGFDLIYGQNPC